MAERVRFATVGAGAGSTWGVKKLGRIGGGGTRGAPAVPTDIVSGGGGWEGDRDGIRGGGWGRGIGARGIGIVRWVDGILEGEERVGEMFKGFADAIRGREREEDVGATVVGGGGREVEAASAVFRPRLAV